MIKAILFDLGGVLFTNATRDFIDYIHTTYGVEKEKVKNVIDSGEIPDAYREGKITRDVFWQKVQEELHLPENIETLEKR